MLNITKFLKGYWKFVVKIIVVIITKFYYDYNTENI